MLSSSVIGVIIERRNKYKHTEKVDPVERDIQRRHLQTKKSALEQLLPSKASTGANLVHSLVSDFWALEL